jgi:hypothetical protein
MNATEQIDSHIAGLGDWRGALMSRLRALINETDPELTEEWKWSTPVFSKGGSVCALGAFKEHVKINFFKGASLPDPHGLFNAGLDAKASRGIDIREGESIDETALQEMIGAAVALNRK